MALEFFGIAQSQEEIASEIGHLPGVGTPARNITRLSAPGVKVQYSQLPPAKAGGLRGIASHG
jgi:hypothetical protein